MNLEVYEDCVLNDASVGCNRSRRKQISAFCLNSCSKDELAGGCHVLVSLDETMVEEAHGVNEVLLVSILFEVLLY